MPNLYILSGANGAGKSTVAKTLFSKIIYPIDFVNADFIASGLSTFNTASVSFKAGRFTLQRIKELANNRKDFAFETTLASRSFAPFLQECKDNKYAINLIYLWLKSPQLALERVFLRAQRGGHSVPDDVVLRRYENGRKNFINLYLPLADNWQIFDNSEKNITHIAQGGLNLNPIINDPTIYHQILQ